MLETQVTQPAVCVFIPSQCKCHPALQSNTEIKKYAGRMPRQAYTRCVTLLTMLSGQGVGSDLQSKLIWGSGIEQGPHPEQGGVLGASEVLEPVGVHLPEAGVVCSSSPPAHDVGLFRCTPHQIIADALLTACLYAICISLTLLYGSSSSWALLLSGTQNALELMTMSEVCYCSSPVFRSSQESRCSQCTCVGGGVEHVL